jgi:hypothetical protein
LRIAHTQTANAAVDAIVRISNRKSKEAAVSALLELQTETIAPDLVEGIFSGSELPLETLIKCSVHRSPAVRQAAVRLMRKLRVITSEDVTTLLNDSDYEVRREIVHHLVEGGRKFSDSELRTILVRKATSAFAGVATADEAVLKAFQEAEYKRMDLADLQKLLNKDDFFNRPIQFAIAERQFQMGGPSIRASLENMFEAEFDNYLAEMEKSASLGEAMKTTFRNIKDYPQNERPPSGPRLVQPTCCMLIVPFCRSLRAGRLELPRAFRPNGFSYHFGFRRRQLYRRSWSGLSLHHSVAALGAARLVSTPSPRRGLARDCQLRFPRIWAVLLQRFPARHSIHVKSGASTSSATPAGRKT